MSISVAAGLLLLCCLSSAVARGTVRGLKAADNACLFQGDKCFPSPGTVLTSKPPGTDADKVFAKVSAHSYTCAQHTDAASCAADTANFCKFSSARMEAACDVDYARALGISRCATSLESSVGSVFSFACSAHFFALDLCGALGESNCGLSPLCASSVGKCSLSAAAGSSALMAFATETGTPLASDIQAAMVVCGAATTAAACASAAPAVTVDAAVVAKYKALLVSQVEGIDSGNIDTSLPNSTIDLASLVSDNNKVALDAPKATSGSVSGGVLTDGGSSDTTTTKVGASSNSTGSSSGNGVQAPVRDGLVMLAAAAAGVLMVL